MARTLGGPGHGAGQAPAPALQAAPVVTGHVTARAPLPSSPLTPNRLVLEHRRRAAVDGGGDGCLRLAAAPPSRSSARRRAARHRQAAAIRRCRAAGTRRDAQRSPTGAAAAKPQRAAPCRAAIRHRPRAVIRRRRAAPISEPPGPIAVQRTVVLTGNSGSAPAAQALADVSWRPASPSGSHVRAWPAPPPPTARPAHAPPAAPLFGSRPPPGAGSYSVSSSHPPPIGPTDGRATRTSVERLSPLQSARPPSQPALAPTSTRRSPPPVTSADGAADREPPAGARSRGRVWAARFDTRAAPSGRPRRRR